MHYVIPGQETRNMRIHSITVRNYRILRDLHVELDRSLTLLGGPNEIGKSTLMEAAHRAFFLRANVSGEAISGMLSTRHVGNPEVTVEFEVDGSRYQISKKFSGSTGSALLRRGNEISWNGEEAETKLAELLKVETARGGRGAGERSAQQWAHLWIWQGQSGDNPAVHATTQRTTLVSRLQAEGGAVAMQSELDCHVADCLAQQCASMFNSNGTPKRNSQLAIAIQQHEEASNEFQKARALLEKLRQAVDASQAADTTIAECQRTLGDLESEVRKFETQLARVAALRVQETSHAADAQRATRLYDESLVIEMKINEIQSGIRDYTEKQVPRQAEIDRLQSEGGLAAERAAIAETAYQEAIEFSRAARLRQELATAFVILFERKAQLGLLSGKLQQVDALRGRLNDRENELARLPAISVDTLARLQELQNECSRAQAALQGMAAGVEVLAADDSVHVGGRLLAMGESHILTDDADITIGSAIRLRITPGGGTSLRDARIQVQETQRALRQELNLLGVQSTAEAAEVSGRRQQLRADIQADRAQMKGLGADSIDEDFAAGAREVLTAESDVQQKSTAVPDFVPPANVEESQSLRSQAISQQREAETEEFSRRSQRDLAFTARQIATDAIVVYQQTLREDGDTLTGLRAQLRLLVETHGEDLARSVRLSESLRNKTIAEQVLADTCEQLRELKPDILEQDYARYQRSITQANACLNEAITRRAVARNTLASDGTNDPQAALAVAEATAQSAKDERDSVERKANATKLLHQLFLEAKLALSEQLTRPFAQKIKGYLDCLFGAGVSVNIRLEESGFSSLEIVRPGRDSAAMTFECLSAGTREQIAAAVRLAMAELIAGGHDNCLPIVFDDAFTNCDPERIRALQSMLDRAARNGLQVVVLSCSPSDYASLGARTIFLSGQVDTGRLPADALIRESLQPIALVEPDVVAPNVDTDMDTDGTVTDSLCEDFISALRSAGGSKGSNGLRQQLGWDEAKFNAIKLELIASRQLTVGRGRGGVISLSDDVN